MASGYLISFCLGYLVAVDGALGMVTSIGAKWFDKI